MGLEAGRILGPYQVIAPLGAGGMGEVYRARDTRLGRELALKILPPDKMADTQRRMRFMQEARAASALNHPNIVTIYDIGHVDDVDFIAMELVRGVTLQDLVGEKGLPFQQALRYAIPIADALSAAHAAGIIHRDLKPGNVMIGEDGQVKLLDFGLAKLTPLSSDGGDGSDTATAFGAGPQTVQGKILGTISYMSPEQAEGKTIDARSDIFSFGTVLYEMVTGRRAFEGGSLVSTLSAILRDEPANIATITGGVPSEIERLIARCLRKDPDKRWQSMRDLRVALLELKEESESGILVAPRAPQRASRRPRGLIAGAAVAVVAVLSIAAFVLARPRAVPAPPAPAPPPGPALPAARPEPEVLTNDRVIEMVEKGLGTRLIAAQIRASKTAFDLSSAAVIHLAENDVPEELIEVMRNPQAPETAPVKAPASPAPASRTVAAPATPPAAAAPAVRESRPAPPAPPPPPATGGPRRVALGDGEPVRIQLAADANLSAAKKGDTIDFVVAEDVVAGGVVVIGRGTRVHTTVTAEERAGNLLRRDSTFALRLEAVTAANGEHLVLRPRPRPSNDPAAGVIGLPALTRPEQRAAKGKDVVASAGTGIYVYVDGDHVLNLKR